MSADGGVRPPVGGTTEQPLLGSWLFSVRMGFRCGYREGKHRAFSDTAQMRAWHRVEGWAEVRNDFAVTIANAVAAGEEPSEAIVKLYRAVSARYSRALRRADIGAS